MNNITGTAIYFAIGMLIYMIFNPFSWSDPWLYIYIGLWPFILLLIFLIIMLVAGIIFCVVGGMINLIKILFNRR